ncbi:MerR family transcriptional regulator [Cuneatibacter caecimuris]|uniref:MerR family transcriptional regulator n=1 Tax=Cuneatibacter caecimuris TaxID=1796618 RepID=A0A4Q7P3J8_9FIRM|nr:MerR family transcriptional regulator [Cuneatibacter caecimuris]RZS94394.1 MerR family transcriptional regulator [Cuneatibacter caecimuris]
MKKFYSVGMAAKAAHITSETLRHYDRIGLVKPSRKDDFTNYRYYTEEDLVRINTVRALQQMDLSLQKIKEVLEYEDLQKIISFLTEAEKRAEEKIKLLQNSKEKIQLAKSGYERKYREQRHTEGIITRYFPERVIMLSDTLETPTLNNLWNYLSHFYSKIELLQKEQFTFEDLAGIYTENGVSKLFAVCIRYENIDGLKILPGGNYLCTDCAEEDRENKIKELLHIAHNEHNASPEFIVQQIVISGILQWNYQLQVYLGNQSI